MRILKILIFTFSFIFENSYSQLPPCYVKSQQDYLSLTCSFKFYKTSPPLSLDMPEEIVKSYLFLDSLMKLDYNSYLSFQSELKAKEYNNQFVKDIVKKTLLIKQFDEIRYFLYKFKPDSTRSLYLSGLFNYLNKENKIDSLINAYYLSSAILKVELTDSIQRFNSKNDPDHTIWKGTIKEILYGSYGPPCKEPTIPIDAEHYEYNIPETRKLQIDDCIQINHIESDNQNVKLNTNKTYYIFTYLGSHCSNYDYTFGAFYLTYDFDIEKFKTTRYYFFEVDGDIVLDPQRIFSESGVLPEKQFKSTVLNELDQARKNGTINRILLGIEEEDTKEAQEIKILNNVNANSFSLELKYPPREAKIEIINLLGIPIFSQNINSQFTNIILEQYPQGIYFLKYKDNTTTQVFKLLRE
jgi:hypothetical protein